MEPTKYERKATEIAVNLGIEVITAHQGGQCPERFGNEKAPRSRSTCKDCGSVHGDKYRVTIKRTATGRSVSFDYWASWNDCNVVITRDMVGNGHAMKKAGLTIWDAHKYFVGDVAKKPQHHKPGYYDILCCVASDASGSTDPDEIFEEYGPMPPSKAEQIAQHARKLQAFFTPAEIEALSHVDE